MNTSQAGATKKKIRFGTMDSDTDSDSNDIDSTQMKQEATDYYDPVYFDTDEEEGSMSEVEEEQDDDEKAYDVRTGITKEAKKAIEPSMVDITEGLEKSSFGAPCKSKKNKKHPTISNTDLLYDPDEDDKDEDWILKKIAANRPPGCKPEDIWTDAILSCPMCLTQLCFDCQQHEDYSHQFRAMFVENCRIIETEVLRFPKEAKKPIRKGSSSTPTSSADKDGSSSTPQEFKRSEDDDVDAKYNPVSCEICNTKVALMDQDEIYHFFNVIPTAV
ncbi:hypothetical protein BG011_007268 [Mortierella polycephala]|uniref:E2F-associated phosphoprotein n=1 Tax=Mortierella polycephala TaxID=41804 RepID=A0A9P6TXY9_9FUNG|nr:hypothetical protein BG011_007268 [Mortierella polycephala]